MNLPGHRHVVTGAGGVPIGLLTAGAGPDLLLVHGGMGSIPRWAPLWPDLCRHRRVTAMDRRGRGTSGDAPTYRLADEAGDIAAVARRLADRGGAPVDVFAHSYGALCTLAAGGSAFGRIVLYEPPGPSTVSPEWIERIAGWIERGQAGRAMVSFLTEIIGLDGRQVDALRDAPGGRDVLAVVAATMVREARAIAQSDPVAWAGAVPNPVLCLLGERSPAWAADTTRALAGRLADARVSLLPGQGHEALDTAPRRVVAELVDFLQ